MPLTAQERKDRASATMVGTLGLMLGCFALLALFALTAAASQPGWWTSRGAVNESLGTNDYAAVNQGQVKQFTARAVDELNADLTSNGGAGAALTNLVYGWQQDYATNGYNSTNLEPADFNVMNVGQLKYIASLVYGQLSSAGYTGLYPSWIQVNTNTDNVAANIGQLKQVFNFDLSVAPATVTGLTASASNAGEIDLSWTLPALNNATSIVIEESTDGGITWTTAATLTDPTLESYAMTGLTQGTSYQFAVVDGNSAGSSAASTPTTSTMAPVAPRYAVIDLGTNFFPVAVNNKGHVLDADGQFWYAGATTQLPLPAGYVSPPVWTLGGPGYQFTGLNDDDSVVATDPFYYYLTDESPPEVSFGTQLIYWNNTQTDPTQPPSFNASYVSYWMGYNYRKYLGLSDSFPGSATGATVLTSWGSDVTGTDVYWNSLSVTATTTGIGYDPNIDQVFPAPNYEDNSSGGFSNDQSKGESINRLGDLVATVAQDTSVTLSGSNPPVFSNFVSTHVLWKQANVGTSTYTTLPFSWPVTAFTDATNTSPTYVGQDTQTPPHGHIYDPSVSAPDIDLGTNNYPLTISTPTGTNCSPQIIGSSGASPATLWDKTYYDGTPSTNTANGGYVAKNLNLLIPGASGTNPAPWNITSVSGLNNGGAIVGTATYTPQGTNDTTPAGPHGVMLCPIDFVYEPVKGSGNYVALNSLPIAQPGSGTVSSSYSTTYGVYQVQLSANLTTPAVGTMTANFSNATGTYTGTLTETGANTGIFQDSTSSMTLTVPVGTTTSSTNITLPATVTCSALGLSSASVTLVENGTTPLTFTQPQLDIAVVFPSSGLSSTAINTITLEYVTSNVTDVTLTETAVNSNVFTSSDGTMSLSITGTPSFDPTVVDTMQVQFTTNLLPGVVSYNLTETGIDTNVFQNYATSMNPSAVVAVDPTVADDGVFYVRIHGITAPSGGTIPLSLKVGVNDPNITMSTPSGASGYAISSKIMLVPPGSTATYAGITTVVMDTLHSKLWTSLYGQTSPSFSSTVPRLPAFLSVGYVPPSDASSAGFDPNAHLKALDAIIGKKGSSGTPPLLGYSNSQVISGLDASALITNLPNYSIFYIIGHSIGTHPSVGGDTFDGFAVWNINPNDTSTHLHILGVNTPIDYSTTPAGKMLIKPNFIQDVLANATAQGSDVEPYNLVFINGCASTCPTSDNGSSNVPAGYVSAFNTQAYVGWPVSVTLSSAAKAAQTFFTNLGGQTKVKDALAGVTASEAPTDYQTGEGINIALLAGTATLPSVNLEALGQNQNVIIDNTKPSP